MNACPTHTVMDSQIVRQAEVASRNRKGMSLKALCVLTKGLLNPVKCVARSSHSSEPIKTAFVPAVSHGAKDSSCMQRKRAQRKETRIEMLKQKESQTAKYEVQEYIKYDAT